jgi:epsilon-lactone hydrolase
MSEPSPRERIRSGFSKPETTLQSTLSISEQRIAWEEHMAARLVVPFGVVVEPVRSTVPGTLVAPQGKANTPLIIYAHGGGFVMGSPKTHQGLTMQLAQAAAARVLLVDYRLAPEHKFPAARDDFVAVYRLMLAQGELARQIVFAGDSAGAHIVMSALLVLREAGDPVPAGVVLISPWLDLAQRGDSMRSRANVDPLILQQDLADCARMYLGEISPLAHEVDVLAADARPYPPLLLHVGDEEILLSDATRLASAVRSVAGQVEVDVFPRLWHVFHSWAPELPEANEAIGRIGQFVRARTEFAQPAR